METLRREKFGVAVMAHFAQPFAVRETAEVYVEAIRIDAFRDFRDQLFRARVDTDDRPAKKLQFSLTSFQSRPALRLVSVAVDRGAIPIWPRCRQGALDDAAQGESFGVPERRSSDEFTLRRFGKLGLPSHRHLESPRDAIKTQISPE